MKLGIFGFPKVGKTTLFNLLTRLDAATDKFSTGHAAPNIGTARVADPRVDWLVGQYKPKKITPATIEFVDVAGLTTGEMKESVNLTALRTVDALVHVVRAFDDAEIPHAPGAIDPHRDILAMEGELLIADLITVEKRLERLELDMKKRKDPSFPKEKDALLRIKAVLDAEQPARSVELTGEEEKLLRGFQFLSGKPVLHVVNLGEERLAVHDDLNGKLGLADIAAHPKTAVTYVLGKLEMEISRLDASDARAFLDDLGLKESGIDRIVKTSYDLLGVLSFFTVGEDEVRAWTIRRGTPALKAAGTIHSDIERGFIRAEVMKYADLVAKGSEKALRDAGLFKLEGKEYVVEDGDIAHFRFNV